MNPCFSKDCGQQRKIFCEEHKAALCETCKDLYHPSCPTDPIPDPFQTLTTISHLTHTLTTIQSTHLSLHLHTHISDLPQFTETYLSKLNFSKFTLEEAIQADTFLKFRQIKEFVQQVWKEVKESEVYRKYCQVVNGYVVMKKFTEEEQRENFVGEWGDEKSIPIEETKEYVEDFCESADVESSLKNAIMLTNNYLHENGTLLDPIFDFSLKTDAKAVASILNQKIPLGKLRTVALLDCFYEQNIFCEFISEVLTATSERVMINCGKTCPYYLTRSPHELMDRIRICETLPKEICLDGWSLEGLDLNDLIEICYKCEKLQITNFFTDDECCFLSSKCIDYNIKEITFYPRNESLDFFALSVKAFLMFAKDCSLKDSLQRMYLKRTIFMGSISALKRYCNRIGFPPIEFIELP